MRAFLMIVFLMTVGVAQAEIQYQPDPIYQKLHDDDQTPMEDMLAFARRGDVRAQFILGDLYSKGKGGMKKDLKESRRWFEESASHGYGHSFIRLAALAKRDNNPTLAWQWYTLAIEFLDDADKRRFAVNARRDLDLAPENIAAARQSMKEWENARDDRLRAERKAELEKTPSENVKPTATGARTNE